MDDAARIDSIEVRLASLEAAVGRLSLQMASSPAASYPEPIATPLAMEEGAVLYHQRFFSLLDAGESCIKYTGIILIAISSASGRPFDVRDFFRQPPSLGRWVELIRNTLMEEGVPDTPIAQSIKASFIKPNGKLTPAGRYLLEGFTEIRNRERGHASALTDGAYKQLHLRYANELHDALGACAHLEYPLVCIESVDVVTDPFTYDIRFLVGPQPLTRVERIQSSSRIKLGSVSLWDNDEILLDLGDILVYKTCDKCNLPHTFFIEQYRERTRDYHSYSGNHRIQLSVDAGGK